jgi:hypothetical protein
MRGGLPAVHGEARGALVVSLASVESVDAEPSATAKVLSPRRDRIEDADVLRGL